MRFDSVGLDWRVDAVSRRSFASVSRESTRAGRVHMDTAGPVIVDYANLEHVDTAACVRRAS